MPAEYFLHLLWLLWIGQAVFGFRNTFMFHRRELRYRRRGESGEPYTPPAVVIIPVKGADRRLPEHVAGLLNLDYPQYRLIFAVESTQDPACNGICALIGGSSGDMQPDEAGVISLHLPTDGSAAGGLTDISIVVAGLSQTQAQKIHNQLAALRLLKDQDRVIVFADADAAMDRDWITRLVGPLRKESIGITTAWRWLIPEDGPRSNLATHFACIINASIVTLQGRNRYNCAWGGSMAIRRETLDQVNMPAPWLGAYNDDITLSNAVAALEQRVYLVPNMIVRSPVRFTWPSLLEFGRRQYLHARTYARLKWIVGPCGTTLYMAGFISVVAKIASLTSGWGWALLTLATVYGFDIARANARKAVAGDLLDDQSLDKLRGVWLMERFLTPAWMFVHWLAAISSAFGRHFEWGGVQYRIGGPRGTRVIKRKDYAKKYAPPE